MLTTACVYRYFAAQPNDRLIQQLLGVLNASISQCELNARPMECSRSDGSVVASPVATTSQSFVTGFTEADSAVLNAQVIATLQQAFFTNLDFVNMVMMVALSTSPHTQTHTTLPAAAAMDAETVMHFFHADSEFYWLFRPYPELNNTLFSLMNIIPPKRDTSNDGFVFFASDASDASDTAGDGNKREAKDTPGFPSLELPADVATFNTHAARLLKRLSSLTLLFFEDQLRELRHEKRPSADDDEDGWGPDLDFVRDCERCLTLNHLLTKPGRPGLETSQEDVAVEEKSRQFDEDRKNEYLHQLGEHGELPRGRLLLCRSLSGMSPFTPYANLFASHFVTFTGVGHEVMSDPGTARAHLQFMQALRGYLTHLEKAQAAFRQATAGHEPKRQKLERDSSDAAGFEEVRALAAKLDALAATLPEHAWSDGWRAYEALRTELLGALVRKCSGDYIAQNDELFELDDVVCVLRNPFTQLLKYLHVSVPVREEGAARVDAYYLHALALVRKYYVYALQQLAVVVVVLCRRFDFSARRSLFLTCRADRASGLRGAEASRQALAGRVTYRQPLPGAGGGGAERAGRPAVQPGAEQHHRRQAHSGGAGRGRPQQF